ncbi:DUF1700 domain-containing protein [Microbacterium sp. GXF6406]
MTATDANRLRDEYLGRLDAAMGQVPHGIAAEVRAGIEEELAGLDAATVVDRIAQLGDPAAIARAVRDETAPPVRATADAPTPKPVATSTRGFAIGAALTLAFGGFLIPIAGWIVGAVLVGLSSLWRGWEKTVAIVVHFLVIAVVVLGGLPAWAVSTSSEVEAVEVGGDAIASNPLMPTAYDIAWTSIVLLVVLAVPASGLWLLWRLRGRARA